MLANGGHQRREVHLLGGLLVDDDERTLVVGTDQPVGELFRRSAVTELFDTLALSPVFVKEAAKRIHDAPLFPSSLVVGHSEALVVEPPADGGEMVGAVVLVRIGVNTDLARHFCDELLGGVLIGEHVDEQVGG